MKQIPLFICLRLVTFRWDRMRLLTSAVLLQQPTWRLGGKAASVGQGDSMAELAAYPLGTVSALVVESGVGSVQVLHLGQSLPICLIAGQRHTAHVLVPLISLQPLVPFTALISFCHQ